MSDTRKKIFGIFSVAICTILIINLQIMCIYADDNISENKMEISVNEEVAELTALLFIAGNTDSSSEWNDSTNIKEIRGLYDADNKINSYCIYLSTEGKDTGYIIISTDLNKALIQEFSDKSDPILGAEGYSVYTIENKKYNNEVYNYPRSSEAFNKNIDESIYNRNVELIEDVYLIMNSMNAVYANDKTIIADPVAYLKEKYPRFVFKNDSYYNIGENAVPAYKMKTEDNNACSIYGVASLLNYNLKGDGVSFKSRVEKVKSIAVSGGYCKSESDYYVYVGNLAPLANASLKAYKSNLTASSSLLSWSTGTKSISDNQPILLNIASDGNNYYNDHTVTAYAWTVFKNENGSAQRFFKVRDGWDTGVYRYVHYDALTGTYITRFK